MTCHFRCQYCILQNELCQQTIVPELATAAVPTTNSSEEEIRAYNGYMATWRANVATDVACYQ
jgi:hypothetical protein